MSGGADLIGPLQGAIDDIYNSEAPARQLQAKLTLSITAVLPTGEGLLHPETPLAEGRSVPGGDRPIAPSVQSSLPGETVRREGEAQSHVLPRVVCSWCGLQIAPGAFGAPISHGICLSCAASTGVIL